MNNNKLRVVRDFLKKISNVIQAKITLYKLYTNFLPGEIKSG